MKVNPKYIKHLIDLYHGEIHCTYLSDIIAGGRKMKAGTDVTLYDLNTLIKDNIKEIDIRFDITIYEYMSREFPEEYRRPVRWITYFEIDKYLEELEKVNARSKRKRLLYIVGDVEKRQGIDSKDTIVLRNGDSLDFAKWKTVKMLIDSKEKFFCRNSECGIIMFGDFKMKNQESDDKMGPYRSLVTAMTAHQRDKTVEISPDFIPTEDVLPVALPGKLLEEYINSNAKLIIISESVTRAHKEALIQVKNFDPFVRMMIAPPLDDAYMKDLLMEIKMMYATDRWKKQ